MRQINSFHASCDSSNKYLLHSIITYNCDQFARAIPSHINNHFPASQHNYIIFTNKSKLHQFHAFKNIHITHMLPKLFGFSRSIQQICALAPFNTPFCSHSINNIQAFTPNYMHHQLINYAFLNTLYYTRTQSVNIIHPQQQFSRTVLQFLRILNYQAVRDSCHHFCSPTNSES